MGCAQDEAAQALRRMAYQAVADPAAQGIAEEMGALHARCIEHRQRIAAALPLRIGGGIMRLVALAVAQGIEQDDLEMLAQHCREAEEAPGFEAAGEAVVQQQGRPPSTW
jgi:hypothetical protein